MLEYVVFGNGEKWGVAFYRDMWLFHPHLIKESPQMAVSLHHRPSLEFEEAVALIRMGLP